MDDVLVNVADANGGYLHREDLLALGFTDKAIHRSRSAGILRRIRVGTYVLAATFDHLTPEEQHGVLARSVIDKFPHGSAALSHSSAAIVHGMAVYDVDLGTVHVTRLDGASGRTEARVVHHESLLDDGDVVERDGRLMTHPGRAAWEAACSTTMRGALVVLDSALHAGLVGADHLDDVAQRFATWKGARKAGLVARFADAGSESVGESLYRFLCFEAGLPRPQTQLAVHDHDGLLIGITDLGWLEYMHLGEFDGLRKYWRDLRRGEDSSAAVVREKRREDRLRAMGFGLSRSVWSDVQPAAARQTASRLRFDLEQSRRLATKGRRHIA